MNMKIQKMEGKIRHFNQKALSPFLIILLIFGIILLAVCKEGQIEKEPDIEGKLDPFNEVESVQIEKGKPVKRSIEKLGKEIFVQLDIPEKKVEEDIKEVPPNDKLHPLIKRWLDKMEADARIDVILTFQDLYQIRRFPDLIDDQPRSSPYNKRVMASCSKLVEKIRSERKGTQEKLVSLLKEYDVRINEHFWITNAVSATTTLKGIKELVKLDELIYIEPVQTEDKPPQNANPNDDALDGRTRIMSDPYFNLGQTLGFIGLLDTGVEPDHDLFNNPDHVDFMYDCVNGGSNCNDSSNANFDPEDDCWNHGTSTAAIITGNNSHGNDFRGVSAITLDNLKVYPNGCGFLNTTAVLRAFQRAIEIGDRVIVAEMQGSGSHWSSISRAADNAFESGAVVIAANGNNGDNASTVNTPANAHKVMGIGNYDVQSGNQINSQSRGPSPDNRYKPDVRFPTNSETASSAGTAAFRVFSGTSGATPYGGAAAALIRNFMRGNRGSVDPGKVYAFIINSGQNPYPFNNDIGAGDLEMPLNGYAWWGKVQISDGQTIEIPINVSQQNRNTFDAAIWWPEELVEWGGIMPLIDKHDDIDLRIIDPNGAIKDYSISVPSVFERVRYEGNVTTGIWKVRINGYDVTGTQTVYWIAFAHIK